MKRDICTLSDLGPLVFLGKESVFPFLIVRDGKTFERGEREFYTAKRGQAREFVGFRYTSTDKTATLLVAEG